MRAFFGPHERPQLLFQAGHLRTNRSAGHLRESHRLKVLLFVALPTLWCFTIGKGGTVQWFYFQQIGFWNISDDPNMFLKFGLNLDFTNNW